MKIKKILAGTLGIGFILFLLLVVNSGVGNPVSNFIAKNEAKKYIAEEYSDLNLQVEQCYYNFKSSCYEVVVKSPVSQDTVFCVSVDSFGRILRDDYEYEVANHFTTLRRLEDELRKTGGNLLRNKLNYEITDAFITFADSKDAYITKLKTDMTLDIHNPPLPLSASVSITDNDISYEKIAQVIKAIEAVCKAEEIPISQYSVSVESKDRRSLFLYDIPAEILDSTELSTALKNFDTERQNDEKR